MPVNYVTPPATSIYSVAGVSLGVAKAGIRKPGRCDLAVIKLDQGCTVGAVFTQNCFRAAPVQVAVKHLDSGREIRGMVVNTGVANAGTGTSGLAAAYDTCAALAWLIECEPRQVLPFSTGVILEPLPLKPILDGLPACIEYLSEDRWLEAAHAIMTTDTVPKATSRKCVIQGRAVTVTGIAKGAGMIRPNMATMLGFIATDVGISSRLMDTLVKEVADGSFNCISIDGDTSTNDSFVLISTHRSGVKFLTGEEAGWEDAKTQIISVALELAQAIVRDGEGATKFITIHVDGGSDEAECRRVGDAIANSPLVKTAFNASDANLGRILAAIGAAGVLDLDPTNVRVWLGDLLVIEGGRRAEAYDEQMADEVMNKEEIVVRVDLDRGGAKATIYTCDLSVEYIDINANYRS